MWKPLKQTFILSVSCLLFGASLSAKECSEMYLEARTECERTAALCSEVKQCKDFRKSCNSDLKTMEGCEQMELCANDESPTLHNERCRYKWWDRPVVVLAIHVTTLRRPCLTFALVL